MTNKDFIVKCIYSANDGFTKGKVYEVKNGVLIDDDNYKASIFLENVNRLNEKFDSKFELVEENETSKFKVGDKVRVRSDRGKTWNFEGRMDIYCDTIQEITEVVNTKSYRLKNCFRWLFGEKDLTLVGEKENNMFKKEDLESGMLVEVEYDNEKSFCLVVGSKSGICISGEEIWCTTERLTENLTNYDMKITKIFSKTTPMNAHKLESCDRKLLWERNEIKEVTMQEIEEKYGCKVKIVKGE